MSGGRGRDDPVTEALGKVTRLKAAPEHNKLYTIILTDLLQCPPWRDFCVLGALPAKFLSSLASNGAFFFLHCHQHFVRSVSLILDSTSSWSLKRLTN